MTTPDEQQILPGTPEINRLETPRTGENAEPDEPCEHPAVVIRMLIAEALQRQNIGMRAGLACMRFVDDAEDRVELPAQRSDDARVTET